MNRKLFKAHALLTALSVILIAPLIEAAESRLELSEEGAPAPAWDAAPYESDLSSIEEELYFMQEDLVTGATKRAVPLAEAPADMFVITNEDIVQSGQTNLAEILRRVPGMDAVYISGTETQVSMRGFANPIIYGTRMAVYVDGRLFQHEFISGVIWQQIPVPLSDIERIEVIKGPMSSLYGSKAVLGIINIVTFEPEETRTKIEAGGGMRWMGMGNFTHAQSFDRDEKYWYKLTGRYYRHNDYTDWRGTGKQKAEEDFAATGKLLAKPWDATRLQLNAGASQTFGLAAFGPLLRGSERRGFVDGNLEQELGGLGQLSIKSYWERHALKSPDLPALSTIVMDNVEAEARHSIGIDLTPEVRSTLTYGFTYRYGDLPDEPVRSLNKFAGFLQEELRLFDRVILTAGGRAEYERAFVGFNWAANGNLLWLAHPKYTFRAGIGRAFNDPNYLHFYTDLAQPIVPPGTGTLIGNRDIKAEKMLYLDATNTVRPMERLTLHASFFYYRLNQLISPTLILVPPADLEAQYRNDGGAEAIGGEIRAEGEIASWLEGYGQWAYQRIKAINGNPDPTPNLGSPKNKVGAGLRGRWFDGRLTANMDFQWTQKLYRQNGAINFTIMPVEAVDHFYLLNVRAAYWPIRERLELAVAANNLLNRKSPQTPVFDPTFGLTLAERPAFNLWGSVRYIF